jgi:hypothetical protein
VLVGVNETNWSVDTSERNKLKVNQGCLEKSTARAGWLKWRDGSEDGLRDGTVASCQCTRQRSFWTDPVGMEGDSLYLLATQQRAFASADGDGWDGARRDRKQKEATKRW